MNQETQNLDWKKLDRRERGRLIHQSKKIVKTPFGWRVISQTNPSKSYLVKFKREAPRCDCADRTIRKEKCKHIWAVEFYIRQEIDEQGKITETRGVKVSYTQEWKAYDNAQTNEKLLFMKLLKDLTSYVEQPTYSFGRPKLPLSEMIFSSTMKVYTTFSLRRFMSDLKIAKEMGLVETVPCYASIGHFLQKKELTAQLLHLITLSSLPLKEVEVNFAGDSTGFSTSRFARWFDEKYGRERKQKMWLKAHVMCGVKTNIVTAVTVTEGHVNDSPQLSSLVSQTAKYFEVKEVSCDRAYSSRENLKLIEDEGALPFIPFKSNTSGKGRGSSIWKRMYHYFIYKHDEFLQHYHKRSNIETTFHMIKTKFKDNLRSRSSTAQVNELLLKLLCHNICVVIQEMNELGVRGEFVVENNDK